MKPATKCDQNIAPVTAVIMMIFAPGVSFIMRTAKRITNKTPKSPPKKERISRGPPRIAAKNPGEVSKSAQNTT